MVNVEKFTESGQEKTMISSCATCKHKRLNIDRCDAFPSGIPQNILTGKNKHKRKYPGDNGIQYEPIA